MTVLETREAPQADSSSTTTVPPCPGSTTSDSALSKELELSSDVTAATTTSLAGAASGGGRRSTDGPQNTTELSTTDSKQRNRNQAESKQATLASQGQKAKTPKEPVGKCAVTADEVEASSTVVVKEQWMSEGGLRALQRCVEGYFSDHYLSTDKPLHHLISQNLPEGWVCCSELLRLEPLRQLGATPQLLLKSLRKSHLETKVTLTADEITRAVGNPGEFGNRGLFVRRRQPLPPLLARDRLEAQGDVLATDPAAFVLTDRHLTLNRLRDLWRVQRQLKLKEVGDDTTVFLERIQPNVRPCYRPPNNKPIVFAVGYERIVYGDHGAYIEFSESQICWKAWPHYFDKKRYRSYFDEFYTVASHSLWEEKWKMWDPNATKGVLMLYAQHRSVSDRAWAPGGGSSNPHAGRPTGYADYRPGYFYLTTDANLIMVEHQD